MTEAAMSSSSIATSAAPARRDIGLKRRHAAEARFRLYGLVAICIGIGFLAILLVSIVSKGYTAFVQTAITVPVYFDPAIIDKDNERATNPQVLVTANYPTVARNAVAKALGVNTDDRAAMRRSAGSSRTARGRSSARWSSPTRRSSAPRRTSTSSPRAISTAPTRARLISRSTRRAARSTTSSSAG